MGGVGGCGGVWPKGWIGGYDVRWSDDSAKTVALGKSNG